MMCPRDGTFVLGSLSEQSQKNGNGDTKQPSLVTKLMATQASNPFRAPQLLTAWSVFLVEVDLVMFGDKLSLSMLSALW